VLLNLSETPNVTVLLNFSEAPNVTVLLNFSETPNVTVLLNSLDCTATFVVAVGICGDVPVQVPTVF
jgi:hypothetical protein